VKRAIADPVIKMVIQASVFVASENGATVRYLAQQFGIPKSTVHRCVAHHRERRDKKPRKLHARTIMAPCAISGCQCKVELAPEYEICLDCGKVSPALAEAIARDREPRESKPRAYTPGKLKGGI
jgi:transposase-like protein